AAVPCTWCSRANDRGWIRPVRPSRRPLRGLLRMRFFFNAIKDVLMLRSAQRARLEARRMLMQALPRTVLVATLAVGACTVGPDYQRPAAVVPAVYKEAGTEAVKEADWRR